MTHLHHRSFDISLAAQGACLENGSWRCFFAVDCVSELGQHHVDAQQAGERGNNLVSDILLNAYISYNASALENMVQAQQRGVSLYLLCNPIHPSMKPKPSRALFRPQLKEFWRSDVFVSGVFFFCCGVKCNSGKRCRCRCELPRFLQPSKRTHIKAGPVNILYEQWIK